MQSEASRAIKIANIPEHIRTEEIKKFLSSKLGEVENAFRNGENVYLVFKTIEQKEDSIAFTGVPFNDVEIAIENVSDEELKHASEAGQKESDQTSYQSLSRPEDESHSKVQSSYMTLEREKESAQSQDEPRNSQDVSYQTITHNQADESRSQHVNEKSSVNERTSYQSVRGEEQSRGSRQPSEVRDSSKSESEMTTSRQILNAIHQTNLPPRASLKAEDPISIIFDRRFLLVGIAILALFQLFNTLL
eukprot:TRINITY_DN6387_c0_g1_i2.p1 TRINITY_DN6387_c0_g1~~TRINITY_DN6387_c0_g1_i2.p1  ORF type:complete len:248 (+),score=49.93 TRINITY_DN6387_c0_g1_i2:48-791(+)